MRFVGFAFLFLWATAGIAAERAPNFIIFYTDDQGTLDAHCFGAKDLVTPNMDRLAREGVRFTQAYAATPTCVPARSSIEGSLAGRIRSSSASTPASNGSTTCSARICSTRF